MGYLRTHHVHRNDDGNNDKAFKTDNDYFTTKQEDYVKARTKRDP